MEHLHAHDPEALYQEINKILDLFPSVENYVKMSATPLATIATSNSALTITSLLLMLNSNLHSVRILSAINLIILLATTSLSIFFLINILRANFRISRVLYRVQHNNYHTRIDYSNKECTDIVFLTHLANKGFAAIDRMEKFYQNLLWRFFFVFIIASFALLSTAVIIQLISIMA